jgi:hypothetical protein
MNRGCLVDSGVIAGFTRSHIPSNKKKTLRLSERFVFCYQYYDKLIIDLFTLAPEFIFYFRHDELFYSTRTDSTIAAGVSNIFRG